MAPELWLMSHGADPRSDVYGLGCTLYELLVGAAPFARSEWPTRGQKMLAHALVPPPPIRELRPEVPEALADVLDRLLAKCPADRYATPADVARALEPFARGHDLRALGAPDRSAPPSSASSGQAGPKPIGGIPRWNGTLPPRISKPIAVPAVLTVLTVLLLARTFLSRWPRPESAPAPVQEALAPPPTPLVRTGELVPATLTIHLYRIGVGLDDVEHQGRIGDPREGPQGAAAVDQHWVVAASFDEPLYPFLIAINPDGTCEPLFPEEGSDSSARSRFQYPSGSGYLELKQDGLLGLILLGSRRPLSADEALATIRLDAGAWRRERTGIPWLFDGERCEPLVRDRAGGLGNLSHGLEPFTDLCLTLARQPGFAAVRAVAFPVKAAAPNP
jgi:hypothetical protein